MKKYCTLFVLVFFIIKISLAQGTINDYKRAEKFLHFNIDKLVYNVSLKPQWINNSSSFWYKTDSEKGYHFMLVYPEANKLIQAFNHQKLAKELEKELKKRIISDSLPFSDIEFVDEMRSILFKVDTIDFKFDTKKNVLSRYVKEKNSLKKNESKSPDGKWIVFIKDYNLYLRNIKTKEEFQLTFDGIKLYDYASPLSWYKIIDESVGDIYDPSIDINWAPDSKKFVAIKLDRRRCEKLYLYQALPEKGMRAKIWSYERALPGENIAMQEFFVFDINKRTKIKVDLVPQEDIWAGLAPDWTKDSKTFFIPQMARYYKQLNLYLVNPETGKIRDVIHEKANTMIESQMVDCELINNGKKIVWMSERDGWSHLYLFDGRTGNLINQITKGEFVVRQINHIDEENQIIYFTAGGVEKGRDPYYKHLYRINFDGTELQLLTPEDAEHDIQFSPDKKYFIDNYSRVDLKPIAVLRRLSDGKFIRKLQEANIDKLLETGWRYPERFKLKARDNKTDIYGIIQYPSTFDSNKKYPIIDNSYSGPQAVNTPKSFWRGIWNDWTPLSEVGFIVMRVDGLGSAMRSKYFHDFSYKNLGDIGAPDHMKAIRYLASKYNYIDTTRVGIFGFSAGGYDAAHAILKYPNFYKVAVAVAGNHDQRMAKAWWPEQYMGEPGNQYKDQSNLSIAKNLKGKLLLVHGDMDNNVNPACTYRLAAELVNNNKDFDLIIIPNQNHSQLWGHKYLIRKRMDFFVKNFWNIDPPCEFKFIEY